MIRKHFRLKRIALGLAFAAIVVPTAQAKVVIDGYTAPASSAAVAYRPIASEISVQSPRSQLTVETQRWLAMAKATDNVSATADSNGPGLTAAGAALSNAKHSAYPVQVTQAQAAGSDGFNWSDAGIGASVAFGVALMLLIAVVLGRRYRSRPTRLAST